MEGTHTILYTEKTEPPKKPEDIVLEFNEYLKDGDEGSIQTLLSMYSGEFSYFTDSSDEYKARAEEIEKSWLKDVNYTINGIRVSEDGKSAEVDVKYQYNDATECFDAAVSELVEVGFSDALLGTDRSDEENDELAAKIIVKHLDQGPIGRSEKLVTFDCVNTEDGWKITLPAVPSDLYNIISGNIYDAIASLETLSTLAG